MKKLLILFLPLFFACNKPEYKYEIRGYVNVNHNGKTMKHSARWFTDTFEYDKDTLFYFNSNGDEQRIKPPYTIVKK